MAWGKTVGVASWVERLKANDASLTSVTVFRGRLFGPDEAAAVSAALRTNTHLLELYASGHAMDAATAATATSTEAAMGTLALRRLDFVGGATSPDAPACALAAPRAPLLPMLRSEVAPFTLGGPSPPRRAPPGELPQAARCVGRPREKWLRSQLAVLGAARRCARTAIRRSTKSTFYTPS